MFGNVWFRESLCRRNAELPCRSGAASRPIATVLVVLVGMAPGGTASAQNFVAVDSHGVVYIANEVTEPDQPVTPGAFQPTFTPTTCFIGPGGGDPLGGVPTAWCMHSYIQRISADGATLLSATYLNGSHGDGATAIAADKNGNIYVAGGVASSDFPVTSDAYQTNQGPTFVSLLSADGRSLLHSTFLKLTTIVAIAVDSQGRVVVAGSAVPPAAGGRDSSGMSQAVVVRLDAKLEKLDYESWPTGDAASSAVAYNAALALDSRDEA